MFQAPAFLRGALSLTGTVDGLPTTCVPELALFAAGRKSALRLVLGRGQGERLCLVARDASANYAVTPVATREVGNRWSSLHGSADTASALVMVVVAADQRTADSILRAEIGGDADFVGEALGYPTCCVSALTGLSAAGELWAHALAGRSGAGPFPWAANRLATGWGGMSPAGELFPCSLRCPAACALGFASHAALMEVGLARLADTLLAHGLEPVRVLAGGEVVRVAVAGDAAGTLVEFVQ